MCSTCGNIFSISTMSFSASCFAPSNSSLARLDEVVLGVLHHLPDLVLREAARRGDLDRLLLAGLEIARADGHDAVAVDLEHDLDLDLPLRRAAQAGEDELAQQLVLRGLLATRPA
jgi:hypothetical protein